MASTLWPQVGLEPLAEARAHAGLRGEVDDDVDALQQVVERVAAQVDARNVNREGSGGRRGCGSLTARA